MHVVNTRHAYKFFIGKCHEKLRVMIRSYKLKEIPLYESTKQSNHIRLRHNLFYRQSLPMSMQRSSRHELLDSIRTGVSATPKVVLVLLLSMTDINFTQNFISADSSVVPDALIDRSMSKLCLIVSEMNHKGRHMWIRPTLLHSMHLVQRRNFFHNCVMIT